MDKFVIEGSKKLNGSVVISGAKNATLALMPATLLASGKYELYNSPNLHDVVTMSKLLESMGVAIERFGDTLLMNTFRVNKFEAPYEHVKKMRASIYVLAPLVARYGQAKVSLPGGCAWGPRPVNLHIEALKKLGANIEIDRGYIIAKAKQLKGTKIKFDISSVGATGNTLMAAVLAKGNTKIENAAMEPEITNLAKMLISMGAKINGVNSPTLEIEGVDHLNPTFVDTIPDRIEAGTFLIATALCGGKVTINNCEPKHLTSLLKILKKSGSKIKIENNSISISSNGKIKPVSVETEIYPGFPTDMQAQWITLMSLANGKSKITDSIYTDRFNHVPELVRLGANIKMKNNIASITGVKFLTGTKIMSTDLRASAALVLAGLVSHGNTEVLRVYHLDRGYEVFEKKLQSLGAKIERVSYKEF